MAIDVDGFAVLGAMATNASVFAAVESEVRKTACALVLKQLKAKATTLANMREIYSAVGADDLFMILDRAPDAQIKTMLTNIDKHNPSVKSENSLWRRQHLNALLSGAAEPAVKPPAAAKKSRPSADESSDAAASPAKKTRGGKAPAEPVYDLPYLNFPSAGQTRKR